MKFDRIDRRAELPRQLSIARTGLQCAKKIAFPVGRLVRTLPDLMNIREREHHVASGGRRERFKQVLGAESLLMKPAPRTAGLVSGLRRHRRYFAGVAAPPRQTPGHRVWAARRHRGILLPEPDHTERGAHRKNGTVFSKSSFESCFK